MGTIEVEVWLYGPLACYGGSDDNISAVCHLDLPQGSVLCDVLEHLDMPTAERGITFINGDLSAMPGLQPDLDTPLEDGDRVAFFHLKSMWPFQYRHDVAMSSALEDSVAGRSDKGLRSRFDR